MTFHFDGSEVISDTSDLQYRARQPFRHVLQTLPDETVPKALVIVGVLAEQLDPIERDAEKQIRIMAERVENTPSAEVSEQTVESIKWLLGQVSEALSSERKKKIGNAIKASGLDSPDQKTESTLTSGDDESRSNDRDAETLPETLTEFAANEPDNPSFACEFCGRTFASETDLTSHWSGCDERPANETFDCPNCDNRYIAEYALTQHLDGGCSGAEQTKGTTSQTVDYECTSCGKQFAHEWQLQKHESGCSRSETRSAIIEHDVSGIIDHYSSDGYGFISTSDLADHPHPQASASEDVFFHISDYPGQEASEREQIKFDIIEGDEGLKAINISVNGKVSTEQWDETFASTRPQWSKDT